MDDLRCWATAQVTDTQIMINPHISTFNRFICPTYKQGNWGQGIPLHVQCPRAAMCTGFKSETLLIHILILEEKQAIIKAHLWTNNQLTASESANDSSY